jgi:hypothetical protein
MDIEGPHEHGHAPHSTGFRWLDISLALSAFLISLISLTVAIHHGRTMDKLVASNSYPNIDIEHSNEEDLHDGQGLRPVLNIELINTGIGPARIRSLEVSFGGKPVRNFRALLAACCTDAGLRAIAENGRLLFRRSARPNAAGREIQASLFLARSSA